MIIRKMADDMRVTASEIEQIASTASFRYKVYRIPKRRGGSREISHPSKEVKSLQRWIVDNVLKKLPVHESVYSYRRGVGIREHAELHRRQNYLLRIDIKDFFPSITIGDVARLLLAHRDRLPSPHTRTDFRAICQICCRHGRLTIGAPSSPAISNSILFAFDKHWASLCEELGIVYSRYADDIYLSTNAPNVLASTYKNLRTSIENLEWPKLLVNRSKVVFTSRKHNKNVTGITLTSDKKLSIGHNKKRWIRSQIYKFKKGELQPTEISYLRGYLAYVQSVEPSLLSRLRRKYSASTLRNLANAEPVMRKTIVPKKKKRRKKT